eukprot:6084472-Lingulodinium_polyedra.AAC.1
MLVVRFVDRLVDRSDDWLSMFGWSIGKLAAWMTGVLFGWPSGWMVGGLVGCLMNWPDGWLIGRLIGWLSG